MLRSPGRSTRRGTCRPAQPAMPCCAVPCRAASFSAPPLRAAQVLQDDSGRSSSAVVDTNRCTQRQAGPAARRDLVARPCSRIPPVGLPPAHSGFWRSRRPVRSSGSARPSGPRRGGHHPMTAPSRVGHPAPARPAGPLHRPGVRVPRAGGRSQGVSALAVGRASVRTRPAVTGRHEHPEPPGGGGGGAVAGSGAPGSGSVRRRPARASGDGVGVPPPAARRAADETRAGAPAGGAALCGRLRPGVGEGPRPHLR